MDLLANNPLLQPDAIQKVVDNIVIDPMQYRLSTELPFRTQPGSKVKVDVRQRMGGMTMAVSPGAESPIVERRGAQQIEFSVAPFREKVILGEKDILDVRRLGTIGEYQNARETVADIFGQLRYRVQNRIEWCLWQMLMGQLEIAQKDVQFTIDYKIPSHFKPVLTGTDKWTDPASDPLANILQWLAFYRQEAPTPWKLTYNSNMEQVLLLNQAIRDLRDSLFVGQSLPSMLTRDNIKMVLNAYAALEVEVNDTGYWLVAGTTAAVAPTGTSVTVDDASGFEVGDEITLVHKDGEYEGRLLIELTSVTGNTLGFAALPGTVTFPIGSEVRRFKTFIPDNMFIIRGKLPQGTSGGTNFGEFVSTNHVYGPGGLLAPVPGIWQKFSDKSQDDPPYVAALAGVTGLPVMYWTTANVVAQPID